MKGLSKTQFKKLYRQSIQCTEVYCYLCHKPILKPSEFNIEHIMPRSRGGADTMTNWAPAHKTCNSKKGALTLDEWKLWLELEGKRNGRTK